MTSVTQLLMICDMELVVGTVTHVNIILTNIDRNIVRCHQQLCHIHIQPATMSENLYERLLNAKLWRKWVSTVATDGNF